MTRRLGSKPGGALIGITIGDMTTTRVPGEYALVYLVFNTINNLTSQDAQVACFKNAAAHLRPSGRFVVEVGVPALRRLPPGQDTVPFHIESDGAGGGAAGFDRYDVVSQSFTSNHISIADGSGSFLAIPFRYAWPAELDLVACIAGLQLEHRWADWTHAPFTADSDKHVSVWISQPTTDVSSISVWAWRVQSLKHVTRESLRSGGMDRWPTASPRFLRRVHRVRRSTSPCSVTASRPETRRTTTRRSASSSLKVSSATTTSIEDKSAFNVFRVNLESARVRGEPACLDEMGTPSDGSDDVIVSTTLKDTALGYIYSGSWAHCWLEGAPTRARSSTTRSTRGSPTGTSSSSSSTSSASAAAVVAASRSSRLAPRGRSWRTSSAMAPAAWPMSTASRAPTGGEPGAINVTANTNRDTLKWRRFVNPSTPVPSGVNPNPGNGGCTGCEPGPATR